MTTFLVELDSSAATNKDFTAGDGTGLPRILPDYVEFVTQGTLVFLDEHGVSRTLTSVAAGSKYPVVIRKITTSSGTIRVGRASEAGLVGPVGPTGAAGDTWTVTALLTGTSNPLAAGQFARVDSTDNVTVTLPTAVGVAGKRIAVKDATDNATTKDITVARTSAQTIDGAAADYVIDADSKCVVFVSDGANWLIESGS